MGGVVRAKDATGLMAFWADVEADYVAEFRRWHNCEHVPERVAIPGFRVGRRYRGIGRAPMFLMSYETDDPAVLRSDAYLERLNSPTPWTRKSTAKFRNSVRTIYRLVDSAGEPAPSEAPYLLSARFDLDPADETAWLEWYRGRHLPGLAALAGVYRVRLYALDAQVSGIQTAERGLHGGVPAEQGYCAWAELASPEAPNDPAWAQLGAAGGQRAGGLERRLNVAAHVFWLDFVMYAPRAA